MTKGDLLRILGPLPLKTEVIAHCRHSAGDSLTHAYTVTGFSGLCVVVSDAPISPSDRDEYYDCEQVWP